MNPKHKLINLVKSEELIAMKTISMKNGLGIQTFNKESKVLGT